MPEEKEQEEITQPEVDEEPEDIGGAVDAEDAGLEAQLAQAQAKAEEYLQGLQRERAEFINYKRRVERERAETYQAAKRDVVAQLLPVLDDFERAAANTPEAIRETDWGQGVLMIERKMRGVLDALGVSEIEALGQPFDPNVHEAVGQGESEDYDSDHVMEVLQKGYTHGDRVIRPAMVRVAR